MAWREAEQSWDDPSLGRGTIPRAFVASADRHADRPAQLYKGGVYERSLAPVAFPIAPDGEFASLDYRGMARVVGRLAAGFRDLGVARGDRVAILSHTRMEWALCDLALLSAGAVVTTVYPGSTPGSVAYLLGDAGASAAVVENAELLGRLGEAGDDDLDVVASIDRLPDGAPGSDRETVYTLDEVYDRGAEAFDPDAYQGWLDAGGPDDLASLVYTSGTTGRPKGVELTHGNFAANVDQCRRRFGPRPDKDGVPTIGATSRHLSFLPLAHVFERLAGHFLMFASGTAVAYAESPDTLAEEFLAVRPTVGTSVPRVYEKLYAAMRERASSSRVKAGIFRWAADVARDHAGADHPGPALRLRHRVADALVFSTVREALGGEVEFLISGGGSLPVDLCRLYHGAGVPVLEGYGLTETAPVVSANPPETPRIGTIGPPVPGVEIRLDPSVVAHGDLDAEGDVGELLVRGPNVFDGYWGRPEETEAAFDDGWFRTGDVVARDDEGYLTFVERVKELLVLSTGRNVAPTPLEDAFAASDLIEQAMAVGDDRTFVGALLVPDVGAVQAWADQAGIELPVDPWSVCEDERVRDRVGREVERVNERFDSHERIKRFELVPEEFTEENGLLTPTMKKKRREILDRHADAVDAIYAE